MDTKNATTNQGQDNILPLVTAGEVQVPSGTSHAGKYIAAMQIALVTVEGCRGISSNSRTRVHTPYGQEMKRVKHYNKFAVEDSKQRTIQERIVNRILAFNTTNSTTYDKLI